jgi:hypothetical protein
MWLFGGAKTKFKLVPGGRTASRRCDTCNAVTTFREVDVTDGFNLFLVELYETTNRRMVCGVCGEDHDPDAFFAEPAKASPRPRPAAPETRARHDADVDQMLAELKRKMKNP